MEVDEFCVFWFEWIQCYLVVEFLEGEGVLCLVCCCFVVVIWECDVRCYYEVEYDYYEWYVVEGECVVLVECLWQGDLFVVVLFIFEERVVCVGFGFVCFLVLKGCGWGEGDFVYQCMEVMLRDVLFEYVSVLDGIDLFLEFIWQRVLNINQNLCSQFFN